MTETFKVGDRATHRTYGDLELTYGPFCSPFYPVAYLGRTESGVERIVRADSLEPAPKFSVGDTVEYTIGAPVRGTLVAGPFRSDHHDEPIWVVEKSNGSHMMPTQNALRKVDESAADTYEHGGVTYDLTAEYRDRDGDRWKFSADSPGDDGTPVGTMNGSGSDPSYTLGYAARDYGPLRKI